MGFNHRAIYLILDTTIVDSHCARRSQRFLFEPWWLREEGCKKVIQKVWEKKDVSRNLETSLGKLEKVVGALSKWGNDTFGKHPRKIKTL